MLVDKFKVLEIQPGQDTMEASTLW